MFTFQGTGGFTSAWGSEVHRTWISLKTEQEHACEEQARENQVNRQLMWSNQDVEVHWKIIMKEGITGMLQEL